MRETRLSGSEGGGNRDHSVLPTPILLFVSIRNNRCFASLSMTGVLFQQPATLGSGAQAARFLGTSSLGGDVYLNNLGWLVAQKFSDVAPDPLP
jgi:hypothetical protein